MRKRTRAREIALQALYQIDLAGRTGDESPVDAIESLIAASAEKSSEHPEDLHPDVRAYGMAIVDGALGICEELDRRIGSATEHWKLDRIAPVDRCILRIALYEILEVPDVPPKVAMNEAIELAKKYSTAESGAFVNGVLDRIYRDLVREQQAENEAKRSEAK